MLRENRFSACFPLLAFFRRRPVFMGRTWKMTTRFKSRLFRRMVLSYFAILLVPITVFIISQSNIIEAMASSGMKE